jgi:hypothetical protein
MTVLATLVDTNALGDAVLWGLGAGIGVTTVFTLALVTATRAGEFRRDGRVALAGIYGFVALVTSAAFIAAIVLGVKVMTNK